MLPALIIIILDQLSKYIVVQTIQIHESITVMSGFFNLVHVRNRGMAFGMLNHGDIDFGFYILVFATIVAIALLIFWFSRLKREEWRLVLGLSFVLGGALGNLIDRLRLQEVIDFLDFYLGSFHWPAFNVADSAITVGTFWIVLNMVFRGSSTRLKAKNFES